MTEHEVRDVVSSMTGSLDEVRREQGWRAIERSIAKPAPVARTRWPWLVVPALAVAIIAVIAWPRSSTEPVPPTTLAAKAGERAVFARDGLTLTLIGPGAATIQPGAAALRVEVTAGTVLGERTSDDAPSVELAAAGNTTTTRDAKFAVRVAHGTVVLSTGEHAIAMIEREMHDLAPIPKLPVVPTHTPGPIEPPITANDASRTPIGASDRPVVPSNTVGPSDRPGGPPDRPVAPSPVVPSRVGPIAPAPTEQPAPPAEPLPPIVAVPLAAKELYARAEASLRVRDPAAAKRLLAQLLASHPDDALVDAARYDLALIAISDHDTATARRYLGQLIESARDPALKSAARQLAATLGNKR